MSNLSYCFIEIVPSLNKLHLLLLTDYDILFLKFCNMAALVNERVYA